MEVGLFLFALLTDSGTQSTMIAAKDDRCLCNQFRRNKDLITGYDAVDFSIAGIMICAGILLYLYYSRLSLVAGLIASTAFGSTALVALSSLGGSSPLIFVLFVMLLAISALLKGNPLSNIGFIFRTTKSAWIVAFLLMYTVVGAMLFPRLFAGKTSVFVSSRETGQVYETVLAPTSGNITQAGYFVLGGLCFFAVLILMSRRNILEDVRKGFFLLCGLHAFMGVVDLAAKYAGAGDVLGFIRSANYALLTEATEAGLPRVVGAFPEASSFGGISLACLAFTYTYWRRLGSRAAFWLSVVLFFLVLFSTSSAAYVGLAFLSALVALGTLRSFGTGRFDRKEILLVAAALLGLSAIVGLGVAKPPVIDYASALVDRTIVHKATSSSGQERTYWNQKSLEAFADTSTLGVGIGSSRASSWPVAVISQLGLIGALMFAALLSGLFFGAREFKAVLDARTEAVISSVRAFAISSLVTLSLIGGSSDPGVLFFVAVAILAAGRVHIGRLRQSQTSGFNQGAGLQEEASRA